MLMVAGLCWFLLLSEPPLSQVNRDELLRYAQDSARFIAHAGGQVDGHLYTNSLEALNTSYDLGFKKFELDIILTADDHYVAAHDWQKWQRMTGYSGPLPPTKAVFMKQPILGQYTPMDMAKINAWFTDHPEAILVTDKVRNAEAFIPQFVDPERLMMELFDWRNVKWATQAGIKAVLPTGGLLKLFKGDLMARLQSLDISAVSVSRNFSLVEQTLIKQLKDAGIKIYAFHVNEKQGVGTSYMICNERQHFYGMYADQWHKNWQPRCDHE